jgi:hypothetical protein
MPCNLTDRQASSSAGDDLLPTPSGVCSSHWRKSKDAAPRGLGYQAVKPEAAPVLPTQDNPAADTGTLEHKNWHDALRNWKGKAERY